MENAQLLAHCGSQKLSREELKSIAAPEGTATHRPVPHHNIVEDLIETLSFRHIGVVRDEYAVSTDGMPVRHRCQERKRQEYAAGADGRLSRLRL